MATIYSNALCTRTALSAESSESELFVRTDPGPVVKIPYFSRKKGKRKYRGHFELVQTLPFIVHIPPTRPAAGFRFLPKANYPTLRLRQEMQESLWNTRGWVFQERTLITTSTLLRQVPKLLGMSDGPALGGWSRPSD